MEVKEVLEELGFSLTPDTGGWRTCRIYKNGDNRTALKIFNNGHFIDFVDQKQGSLEDLVNITLGLNDLEQAKNWLEKNEVTYTKSSYNVRLKQHKKIDKSILSKLVKNHTYWNNRGISSKILDRLESGVIPQGSRTKLDGRYCFPIYNAKKELIGVSGRDIFDNKDAKWKHCGQKDYWCYPLFWNKKIVGRRKEIILLESIGDLLSLFEAGIYTGFVIFGASLSNYQLRVLLRLQAEKIIIALNNDSKDNYAGNNAAKNIQYKLLKYFDPYQIQIALPETNDFNEMLVKQGKSKIKEWYRNC